MATTKGGKVRRRIPAGKRPALEVSVNVRISREIAERIQALADRQREPESFSKMVRLLILEGLDVLEQRAR